LHIEQCSDVKDIQQLNLRGEHLEQLSDRSAAVQQQAEEFQQLSKLLLEKFK
jgi:hypothetical protein